VGYIWGVKAWYLAQSYDPVPITSVRTDPVISSAANIWGGFPEIEIEDTDGKLPEKIKKYIITKTMI